LVDTNSTLTRLRPPISESPKLVPAPKIARSWACQTSGATLILMKPGLAGAAVKPDDDSTRGYYGKPVAPTEVLSGKGPSNENSNLFLTDVREAFHEAKAKEASGN